jgi:hypothetical protein
MTTNGEGTIKYRVGELEEAVKETRREAKAERDEIKADVKTIMTNHLPHLSEEIASLKSRVAIFGTLILGAIGTMISLFIGGR